MALRKKKKYHYGDSQADIKEYLLQYSQANGYTAEHFVDAVCVCGGTVFQLFTDEDEGIAVRICSKCQHEHPIGDSDEYLDDAELGQNECLCGSPDFEITAGFALYAASEDVKWLYLGCRCPKCGLTGCYGDWKSEFQGYRDLMSRI